MKQRFKIRFRGLLISADKATTLAASGEYRSSIEAKKAAKAMQRLKPLSLVRISKTREYVGTW